jgi:hypothetical protein
MLGWIVFAIVVYIVIGIGILLYGTITDPYGGLILQFWWLVILFYPYLLIRNILDK